MESNISRGVIIRSFVWKLAERGGAQLVGFIVTLVLARLLSPDEYGIISIVNIFLSIATVLIQGGMNTALIQKKEIDRTDISTVFFLSLAVFILLYIILYFSSSYFASFFSIPLLEKIIPLIAISLIFGAINSVQIALLTREMKFKEIFKCTFLSVLISGILGVFLAYKGYGVWALVGQQFTMQLIQAILLTISTKWFPQLLFSWSKLKQICSYSINIMLSNLSTAVFLDLRSLVIGKLYSPADLSYFDKGKQFPQLVMNNVNTSILSVIFPVFSSMQNDVQKIKALLRRTIKVSSFIIFPIMMTMVVIAHPMIELLLTDKWIGAVPFIQVFAITYMLMPLHQSNLEAIKAMGRSGIILKLDILRKTFEVLLLILTLSNGTLAIAIGAMISNIISLFINLYPNKNLIDYKFVDQIKDVLPNLLLAVTAIGSTYFLANLNLSPLYIMTLQIIVGWGAYILFAYLFRVESFSYIISIIRKK